MRIFTLFAVGTIHAAATAAQSPPSTPFVIPNVSPGECITFGTWWATDTVSLHSAPSAKASVRATLTAADTFQVVTGELHVDQLGAVVLVRDVEVRWEGTAESLLVPMGDTLWIVRDAPESILRVWHRGRETMLELVVAESSEVANQWPHYQAYWVVPWLATYWAHAETAGGQAGWLNVTAAQSRIGTRCYCC